jgi:hypothetical protein
MAAYNMSVATILAVAAGWTALKRWKEEFA